MEVRFLGKFSGFFCILRIVMQAKRKRKIDRISIQDVKPSDSAVYYHQIIQVLQCLEPSAQPNILQFQSLNILLSKNFV